MSVGHLTVKICVNVTEKMTSNMMHQIKWYLRCLDSASIGLFFDSWTSRPQWRRDLAPRSLQEQPRLMICKHIYIYINIIWYCINIIFTLKMMMILYFCFILILKMKHIYIYIIVSTFSFMLLTFLFLL